MNLGARQLAGWWGGCPRPQADPPVGLFLPLLFFSLTLPAAPADWSSLYTPAKLQAEKPRLQEAVDYVIKNEVQPFIPPDLKVSFGLQPFELPILSGASDPLSVYSQNGRVELPVLTLLFVEDLARAYGWLTTNRYTTKTVDEYLAMLRYRKPEDFPDHRYPPPLTALHIPENALSDPKVVDISVKTRRTAYAFLLMHQYAHVHLQLDGKGGEEAADAYALDILKGNSTTPTGVLFVMQSWVFFEGGNPDAVHPVSARRLRAIAKYMDAHVDEFVQGRTNQRSSVDVIHSIASLLNQSAEYMGIPGHQDDLRNFALKTDVASLKPRPLPVNTR
jgi:hypothetical protein